jgi:endonuclease/exonuclease/phosphatase family metal-dependent hydrolase
MSKFLCKCLGDGVGGWSSAGWRCRKSNRVAPIPQAHRFILGTWNLEQLNSKHVTKLHNIADTILESEAHLVAVQEVSDQQSLGTLCSLLGTSWSFVTHRRPLNTSRPFEYGAFIYKKGRVNPVGTYASTFDHETMHMYVGKHKLMQRSPFMCRFVIDDQSDIVVVSIHAKAKTSQCGPVRDIYALWDVVERWHHKGDRVFIVGDFNTRSDDTAAFCKLRYYGGYRPVLEDPMTHTNVLNTEQYDNIWSTQPANSRDVCVWRHTIPVAYDRTTYPNHCLITAKFDVFRASKARVEKAQPLDEHYKMFSG